MSAARAPGRWASLGGTPIRLPGPAPAIGGVLATRFAIPPARNATAALTASRLCRGRVVVSTLPNIGKHACAAQILDLEEHLRADFAGVRLVHVSADPAELWEEVDLYHASLSAEGYSIDGADPASRAAFTEAFGVAVEGHRRIAHGMFALVDGVFVVVDIPHEQLGVPDVYGFLGRLSRAPAAATG
jgi:hypothetical protein